MIRKVLSVCLVSVCSLAVACAPPDDILPKKELPKVEPSDRVQLVKDNNTFAMKVYQKLRKDKGNVFFSPYSISSALSMTYAGAKGDTAKGIRKALQLTLPDGKLHPAAGWLMIDMNNRGHKGDFTLRIANRLWGQENYPFVPSFLKLTADSYLAGLEAMDFRGQPEESRKTINKWVEDKTRQKIKNLLPQGSINDDTRLVLTNAIYFKADWKKQFKPSDTYKKAFHLSSSAKKEVDMMHASEMPGKYADMPSHKMLALPYKGKELSMVLLLPNSKDGLSALEDSLTSEKLTEWMKQLTEQKKVAVVLPKFTFSYKKNLNDILKDMGMGDAFDRNKADFSGLASSSENLHISGVYHKAFIKVSEEGSEAAAATGVVFGTTSADITKTFIADRPFLFMIRDNTTGSILFLGRVADPTK